MTIFVCIDTDRGMSFFARRQSADSVLRKRIIEKSGKSRLLMNAYTASQFRDDARDITVTPDPLGDATDSDAVFIEDIAPSDLSRVDRLVIYRWNKRYPSDRCFSLSPYESGMTLDSICDFSGSSHDRITEEVWIKDLSGGFNK